MSDYWRRAAYTVPCPYCQAEVSERCLTTSGRTANWPHGDRSWVVQDALMIGYEQGLADAIDMGERAINQLRWARLRNEVETV